MNVNLGETFDTFVAELLKSGLYQSQSEVIREGLRLLKEREDLKAMRLSQLRTEIDKGLRDVAAGQVHEYDQGSLGKAIEESKFRSRKKLAARKRRAT